MGLIDRIFGLLFGTGSNGLRETIGVFRENTEAGAVRDASLRNQAMAEHGAEFARPQKGRFDRFMDGVNRLPRPAMALGTLGLFVAAMVDPIWFAARMQGIALVPDPLWWLLGAIVSFYFGARYQMKGQEFQRSIAETMLRAPEVTQNIGALTALAQGAAGAQSMTQGATPGGADVSVQDGPNPALEDWRRTREHRSASR